MKRANQSGFTLVEVVISMGMLVMGMGVLLSLLTFGAALTKNASNRARSSMVIESVTADLQENLFPTEEDGSVGEPPARLEGVPVPGVRGATYTVITRPHPEGDGEYLVDVTVSWEAEGVSRKERFTTLMLRELPFGERMRRRFIAPRPDLKAQQAQTVELDIEE